MDNNTSHNDIGFGGLLTIVFIVLKLCKVITWGWVWVLAPTWIPVVIAIALIFIGIVVEKWENK